MGCTRSALVDRARNWVGLKEDDGSFREIIDTYNAHKPLARGYKLKYTDDWCSGFASACAIACDATDIIPTEVGCGKHISRFKEMGIWVEDDAYVPRTGDYIFYDWRDDGKGENTDGASHVGIVEKVEDGKITVIEGNYCGGVGRRVIWVNGKYIRGYGTPKYDAEEEQLPRVEATTSAQHFSRSVAGTYRLTASALNVRYGPGVTKKKMVTIPLGTKVRCYGYFSKVLGVHWLKIRFVYHGIRYTGFASGKYLER